MIRPIYLLLAVAMFSFAVSAQPKPRPKPFATPTPETEDTVAKFGGVITGKTYRNESLRFELTVPDGWFFAGRDFESILRKDGIDLSVAKSSAKLLFTAFRAETDTKSSAIARFASEDITLQPQITDKVDYLDAVRASFKFVRPPAGFKYSETQVEKLAGKQFAYLEIESTLGKKRMYVMLRGRTAILMTLSYKDASDLGRFRRVLDEGDFDLR